MRDDFKASKNEMTYQEKLRDPRWQKKRLAILERDHFICMLCFSDDKELHAHHKLYWPNRDPWDYQDEELVTLCTQNASTDK